MRRNLWTWLLVGGAGILAYKVFTQSSASGTLSEKFANLSEDLMNTVTPSAWKTSAKSQQYVPFINSAEMQMGIPQDLLARIAYQESRFRDDIVSGATRSPVGAVGLMQLMPQYFPNAGQSWQNDVFTAGNDLLSLYQRFQDWQLAVAAYNWGQGNVNKWLTAQNTATPHTMPAETSKYVSEVFADVPIAGSLVNV